MYFSFLLYIYIYIYIYIHTCVYICNRTASPTYQDHRNAGRASETREERPTRGVESVFCCRTSGQGIV